jgi:hypothetical protein
VCSILERKAREKEGKDRAAYDLVQKILADGCPKKSRAVSEAASALKRSERAVWTSIKRYPKTLERHEKANAEYEREMRIALGEESPTDEEIEEAGARWIQQSEDLRRGK